jgi:hypothetical protein
MHQSIDPVEPVEPSADKLRAQLELDRQAVAQQQALLKRMQRGRESQQAAFVHEMDRRYGQLAVKEQRINQQIQVLDKLLTHLTTQASEGSP